MKILVLNRGSATVKCSLFDFPNQETPIWEDKIEWKNVQKESIEEGLQNLLKNKEFELIGHRIVHGGKKYSDCVRIDSEVKNEIAKLSDLAPLHNQADLEGIEILEKLYPNTPQYAVFDTAFHHTLPEKAKVYAVPYEWYEQGIQRFGFHGINYQYCTRQAEKLLGKLPEKMVICHLGSGASICAVLNGKSVDTTMGFTPLEGLVMDTRSGSIDPGILLYLSKKKNMDDISKDLYEQSGLLGLSGISSDMRDILSQQEKQRAALALDIYLHQLIKEIYSMVGSLRGLDTLVFTGGIGENAPEIRKRVCEGLSFLGVHLEKDENPKEDAVLSSQVLLIHANEAFEIASQIYNRS